MPSWKARISRYSRWLAVLVTGMLIPILTNLASSWLEMTLGRTPSQLLQLLAIVLFAALALWVLNAIVQERQEPLVLVPRDNRPERLPALIALVGRGRPEEKPQPLKQAAAKAIEYHLNDDDTLKVCWLVASSGEEGSVVMARAIRREYEPRCQICIREVGNPFSVQDTYDIVQRIYNQEIYDAKWQAFELTPERVIADFTSGTAPMTAGMVLACGRDRPMQYTTGHKKGIASVPMLVQFQPTRRRRGPAPSSHREKGI